jgi:hypothetical protein
LIRPLLVRWRYAPLRLIALASSSKSDRMIGVLPRVPKKTLDVIGG